MVQSCGSTGRSRTRFLNETLRRIFHCSDWMEPACLYQWLDDLNHLVKGGRLSQTELQGSRKSTSIKPILYFNHHGVIEVLKRIRTGEEGN